MTQRSLFRPHTELLLEDGTVTVKQLPFLKAMELLRRLSRQANQLFDERGRPRVFRAAVPATATEAAVPARIDIQALEAILAESSDLVAFILLETTGRDQAWLDGRTLTEGILLLKTALAVNLDEELMNQGKGLAAQLRAAFGRTKGAAEINGSPRSSTASSTKATPPAT